MTLSTNVDQKQVWLDYWTFSYTFQLDSGMLLPHTLIPYRRIDAKKSHGQISLEPNIWFLPQCVYSRMVCSTFIPRMIRESLKSEVIKAKYYLKEPIICIQCMARPYF